MEFDFIRECDDSRFFTVESAEIEELKSVIKCDIPFELKEFWEKVGYGFIGGSEYNINRVMDPLSVRDFRLRAGDFEFLPDIEIYEEYEKDKVIFFEASESAYISIGVSNENRNKIYYYDVKIADSLREFLENILKNEDYYLDMFE